MHQFLKYIFGTKTHIFRRVPLPIIRRFSLYTQQRYMSYKFRLDPARKLSANLHNFHHCCVYSVKLMMVDRETAETCGVSFQN